LQVGDDPVSRDFPSVSENRILVMGANEMNISSPQKLFENYPVLHLRDNLLKVFMVQVKVNVFSNHVGGDEISTPV